MVDPEGALANLKVLELKGALGPYGFRDAIDYTRPDPERRHAVVRTYMAHHLGMGLVALTNVLNNEVWQRRFHAEPMVRSAELLLHERIPRRLVLQEPQRAERARRRRGGVGPAGRAADRHAGHGLPTSPSWASCRTRSWSATPVAGKPVQRARQRWQSDGCRDAAGSSVT
jgi:cyclic beta-1,2-glucan synthetase